MKEIRSKLAGVTYKNKNGKSRQKLIATYCHPGINLILEADLQNEYDDKAVKVLINTEDGPQQIGFVRKGKEFDSLSAEMHDIAYKVGTVVTEVTGGGDKTLGVNVLYTIPEDVPTQPPVKQTQKKEKKKLSTKTILVVLGALLLICVLCAVIGSFLPEDQTASQPIDESAIYTEVAATAFASIPTEAPVPTAEPTIEEIANQLVAEYEGNYDVYIDLLTSTDCAHLQESFDRASDNHEVGVNNNDTFKMTYTTSYMTISDQRMREIGCYK